MTIERGEAAPAWIRQTPRKRGRRQLRSVNDKALTQFPFRTRPEPGPNLPGACRSKVVSPTNSYPQRTDPMSKLFDSSPTRPTRPSTVSDARGILEVAIDRVRPSVIFSDASAVHGSSPSPLDRYAGIRILAFGKAALAMAGAVERALADEQPRIRHTLVVIPPGYADTLPDDEHAPSNAEVCVGDHPVAGEKSAAAGRRVLEAAQKAGPDELLLVLISGGGTSLTSVPVDGIEVWDLRHTYRLLIRSGAPIRDVNVVRKHLTRVGGGQLAQAATPADVAALVISDVPGDDLSVIASGPTVPDPSTFDDAVRVAYRSGIWHDLPETVRAHLSAGARGRRPETPATDEAMGAVHTSVVGSNALALDAAAGEAARRGYRVASVHSDLHGEARTVGRRLAGTFDRETPEDPICRLWGGETTVTVRGEGRGGRNQELALAAALEWEGQKVDAVLMSAGTDGIDGPTDAAGAWADAATAGAMRAAGIDPAEALEENDSYSAHGASQTRLHTGPTHTNVMDVVIGVSSSG